MQNQFPTRLAKSVAAVIEGHDPLSQRICDRTSLLTHDLVLAIQSLLQFGYAGRKPRSQKSKNGLYRPTDMDLASFLVSQLRKPTIFELPAYTNTLPRVHNANERHLGERRYGQLLSLSSHREQLSFGVTIKDMSIVKRGVDEADSQGATRTFLIMNHAGEWHRGWQGVSWQWRHDEEKFRERYDFTNDHEHRGYLHFLHPNRRHSIFSRAHLLLKLLWQRLDEELSHYRMERRANSQSDVNLAQGLAPAKSIMVPMFTMTLDGLPLQGRFTTFAHAADRMEYVQLLLTWRTQVQFLVRANEIAFFHHGRKNDYVASWLYGASWVHEATMSVYMDKAALALSATVKLSYATDVVSKKVAV